MVKSEEEYIENYFRKLIVNGKKVITENPDKLSIIELENLSYEIMNRINEINSGLGYETREVEKPPILISKERRISLFVDFIDWYDIVETPSYDVYKYVLENYPLNRCTRILCVGDGENSHLGRKLAMKGYQVVCVDPVAKKEFSSNRNKNNQERKANGNLHVVQGEFFDISEDMINWADLIVGSKIPCCAESLIGLNKTAVFNISENAEVHNMRFKGKKINSSKQLKLEIMKCEGVRVERRIEEHTNREKLLFICNEREYGEVDGKEEH